MWGESQPMWGKEFALGSLASAEFLSSPCSLQLSLPLAQLSWFPFNSLTSPGLMLIYELIVHCDDIPDIICTYGEKVEIELPFTNGASEPAMMTPFPPEIIIERPHLPEPDSVVRSFFAGTEELRLSPDESATYIRVWDQRDDGGKQVSPGWYCVEVTVHSRELSDTGSGGTTRGWCAQVLILPPEGVMEEDIEVNRSKTVDGIAVTLERVELSAMGIEVYAFSTPPGYSSPEGEPGLPHPQFMIHAEAEYSVDDGAIKNAGSSANKFLENGIQHTWHNNLDPVPNGAKELKFIINRVGKWWGPWEFEISLE